MAKAYTSARIREKNWRTDQMDFVNLELYHMLCVLHWLNTFTQTLDMITSKLLFDA